MDESSASPPPPAPPDTRAERAAELAVLDRMQDEMADVDRALERLDDGSYGTCEVCGEAIADDVLETAPATRLCPEHQRPEHQVAGSPAEPAGPAEATAPAEPDGPVEPV